MPQQKIVSVKVDDAQVWPLEAHYVVSRGGSHAGTRVGNSMSATAFFTADISDKALNKPDDIIKLWKYATEVKEPNHKISIQYFKSDDEVLNTVKFTGWVSQFEMVNGNGDGHTHLRCELVVMLDDANFKEHTFTK